MKQYYPRNPYEPTNKQAKHALAWRNPYFLRAAYVWRVMGYPSINYPYIDVVHECMDRIEPEWT